MSTVSGANVRPSRPGGWRSVALLASAFAAIAIGFLASTLYAEKNASQIDREANLIETNSLPSVELLVAAESSLRHIEVASQQLSHGESVSRRGAELALDAARGDIEREVAAEALTGMYPGEAELAAVARRALRDLDVLLTRLVELAATDPIAAEAFSGHEVRGAIERTDAALDSLLALNAGQAHAEAIRIAHVRAGSLRLAFGLDALCFLFSAAAGIVAIGALRRQQRMEQAYGAVLLTRADEPAAVAVAVERAIPFGNGVTER